jgi:uncharacterized membrane protein YozB (DUF420 family)
MELISSVFSFSRASWAMDLTAFGLLLVVPLLFSSIYLARQKKKFQRHKTLQILISVVLGLVVTLFEVDVRLNDWRPGVQLSPYADSILYPVLYVHLGFAITTAALWVITMVGAMRRFDPVPRTSHYSERHKRLGWITALGMLGTAVTGWLFYYLGFIAT